MTSAGIRWLSRCQSYGSCYLRVENGGSTVKAASSVHNYGTTGNRCFSHAFVVHACCLPGESPKVRAAAMRAWSFLYTSLRHSPSSATLEPLLPTLASQLHDPDVEARAAAGEALALIYHTTSLADENSSEEDEEEEEVESMSVVSSGSLAGLEDVVDRMKELATNKGEKLRRSKRDKAAMRSVFRELHGTLQVSRRRRWWWCAVWGGGLWHSLLWPLMRHKDKGVHGWTIRTCCLSL